MDIKYRLQQYEDGTFGYYLIDGDEHCNYKTESKVVYIQGENEDRDEFITKNGITFTSNQYGSNLKLDKLVNDEDSFVRKAVTRQGYGLDKLVNDEDGSIRAAVAEQSYGLDILVNDEDWGVRLAVVRKGYGLDKLVNDKDPKVRAHVARKGYGLDKLVHDENSDVRAEVAEQGYGLNILVNDENYRVREVVARRGYDLEKLVDDESNWVRVEVAEHGYGLDKLINDEDPYVRAAVARQGYDLDKLIIDENIEVRKLIADYLNWKDDDFIINLGNKLIDKGYKLSTNNTKNIFTDETCTKFREFHVYGTNGLVYQILARLLWKNIRVKEIYDPNYPVIMKIYLRQMGKLEDD